MRKTREKNQIMEKIQSGENLVKEFQEIAKKEARSGRVVLYVKAIAISVLFFVLWGNATFNLPGSTLGMYTNYILMGMTIPLIGFWIFHDVGHGTFFESQRANRRLYLPLGVITGASLRIWKAQHDLHHAVPNGPNDTDVQQEPFLRLHKSQKRKWFHRFQFIYAFPLYSLGFISWIYIRDLKRAITGRIDDGKGKPRLLKWKKADYVNFWLTKALFTLFAVVIPIAMNGPKVILPIVVMFIVTGFLLSLVFQPAHVNHKVENIEKEEEYPVGYFERQLRTTMDFGVRNPFWSFLLGSLNLQVLHHVAPNLNHTALNSLRGGFLRFVRERNLPYHQTSMLGAIRSHLIALYRYGNN